MKRPTTTQNLVRLALACGVVWVLSCDRDEGADSSADAQVVDTKALDVASGEVAAGGHDATGPMIDAGAGRVTDTGRRAPAPSPWTATGKLVDITATLVGEMKLDPGSKGSKLPQSNIGMLVDIDADGLVDAIYSDGLGKVWHGRAISPGKWISEVIFTADQPIVGALAAIDLEGEGELALVVGGSHLHLLVPSPVGWQDVAQDRGLKLPVNIAVQHLAPGDFDGDGLMDLAVVLFTCNDKSRLYIFVNRGDGHFDEVAEDLGLNYKGTLWAVLVTDVDGDGHSDMFALAESCDPKHGNAYFRNRGFPAKGSRYELTALPPMFLSPKLAGGTPMGGTVGDVDNDGRLDYALSDIGLRELRMGGVDLAKATAGQMKGHEYSANHLLVAQKDGGFDSLGIEAGIATPLSETGQSMVSWAMRFADLDADGHLDLLVTHGHDWDSFLLSDEGGMRPVLFRNRGDMTFEDLSAKVGLPAKFTGRPMAVADIDGDGDLDLFLGGQNTPPKLLRNDIVHGGQVLTVVLRGSVSNSFGLGARLTLKTDVRSYVAEMSTHAPTHTMDQPLVHFAWPAGEKALELRVRWPSGFQQVVPSPTAGKPLVVDEPPLVKLTKRTVYGTAEAVTVQVRAYKADGKSFEPAAKVTIELAPGASGQWNGPTKCAVNGECFRQWQGTEQAPSVDAIVVTIDGQALKVRPKIRTVTFK